MEPKRKVNETVSAIVGDFRAIDAGGNEVQQIADVLGIDLVGMEMQKITGLSAPSLSRLAKPGSTVESRRWRHITVVAAVTRELVTLMDGAARTVALDPKSSRRWLMSGQIPIPDGRVVSPIVALSDDTLAQLLLAELRQANS